jgi:hypothetical protein
VSTTEIATWAQIATMVAALASVGSLLVVAWQLRSLARQTAVVARQAEATVDAIRASAHHADFATAIEVDKVFLAQPSLRERFYGRLSEADSTDNPQQVEAAAEMLLDMFALVTTQNEHATQPVEGGFIDFVGHIVRHSPDLRRVWHKYRSWYQIPELREIMDQHVARVEGEDHDRPASDQTHEGVPTRPTSPGVASGDGKN